MGYQEILYHQPESDRRRLVGLQAEFLVDEGAYLWIELHKQGTALLGVRLSRNARYPSGFYRFGPYGRLLSYMPFSRPFRPAEGWNRLKLDCRRHRWRLLVNGVHLGSVSDPVRLEGYVGFRGSGNSRAAAKVKNIHLTFADPRHPGRQWTLVEKFSTRRLVRAVLLYATAGVLAIFLIRALRSFALSRLLSPTQGDHFLRGELVLLILGSGVLGAFPASRGGQEMFVWLLAAEILTWVIFAVSLRRPSGGRVYQPVSSPLFPTAAFLMTAAVIVTAFWLMGGSILRPRQVSPEKLAGIHPAAFIRHPDRSFSDRPFTLQHSCLLLPGRPLFVPHRAYNAQKITCDFVLGSNATLDVVFQQQSYLTRGDREGELLPLQRRLVRVSTRPDVPMGVAVHTGNRPNPFVALRPRPEPGTTNHLEILSTSSGLRVELNGSVLTLPSYLPLGRGETGAMCFDGPVRLLSFSVRPTVSGAVSPRAPRLLGFLLLPALFLAFTLLLQGDRRTILPVSVLLSAAVAFPFTAYLLVCLLLGRENIEYLGRVRLTWLDLSLLGSFVGLLSAIAVFRSRLRAAVVAFNLAALSFLAAASALVWDSLPEEHALRLRFSHRSEPPGEIVNSRRGRASPWYTNNRYIGAGTYIWKQQFGGEPISPIKPDGVIRIFLVGGSQAWGSGAADSRSTFAELLERRLRRAGLPVEIFNAGINGAGMSKILVYYQQLLRRFQPDIILADIGLNDSAVLAQKKNPSAKRRHRALLLSLFEELLDACQADGADLLLCLEPMSMELGLRPDPDYYRALEAAVRRRGWISVNPLAVTRRAERYRMLWWDTAHLAPAGHYLMSRLLAEPVAEAVCRRLNRRAPPAAPLLSTKPSDE